MTWSADNERNQQQFLRAAAQRQGVTEAELVRRAVHLAALAERRWDEPFFRSTYEPQSADGAEHVLSAVYDEMADRFQDAGSPPP